MLPIFEYCSLNMLCNPNQSLFISLNDLYHSLVSPVNVKQNLYTLSLSWNLCVSIQLFVLSDCALASSSGFLENSGLKCDQFNGGICGMGCCGTSGSWGTWGTWGTAGIGGFWGGGDLEEPKPELLVWWVEPEDLGHWLLLFCCEYTFPCLKFVWYVSVSFLHSVILIRISFILVLTSQTSPHVV